MTTTPKPIVDSWADDSGLVWIRFNEIGKHGIDEAKDVVNAHEEVSGPVRARVMSDLRGLQTGADRHARAYYISDRAARYKLCMAMLVSSPLQKIIGNIFIRVSRPPYPTKLFTDEAAAAEWLHSFEQPGVAPTNPQTVSIALADVWPEPNQVVHIELKETDRHDESDAKEFEAIARAFLGSNKVRVFADMRAMTTSPDRAARAIYAESAIGRNLLCVALLASSDLQAKTGNLFISTSKTDYPVRLFTNQAEAERWMHSFPDQAVA
jgi:hypothetical protein